MNLLTKSAVRRPKTFMWAAGLFSVFMIALVAAPSLAPQAFPFLQPLKVDTDPENMLARDEPVRIFHNQMKAEFDLHDLIVVGVVNEAHSQGVFNTKTLANIYDLAEFAKTIRWTKDGQKQGIIGIDVIAPSTVDNIEQAGASSVQFSWLLPGPPQTDAEALAVRTKAMRIPTLHDTLVSADGQAIALYIPITSKDVSYRVASRLREKIAAFEDDAAYYVTGLPIAQDQFGVEMFKQMAISAPLAMALIFVLMWAFFRQLTLVVSPMVVAMVSVIGTMGLLVATGHTVHIMSSMIPIFIMPIAVLDAVHILSDFHDRYPAIGDRRETIRQVMKELWSPMFYTTLTTCAGFGSLAFTPIPPVQVFGIFVAIGVFLAWFFTITLLPAYIMLMPEKAFARFGATGGGNADEDNTWLARFLRGVGGFAYARARLVALLLIAAIAVAAFGISRIVINDNPINWFAKDHEIRVADRVLNARFAGTYMAYLTLQPAAETDPLESFSKDVTLRMTGLATDAAKTLSAMLNKEIGNAKSKTDLLNLLVAHATGREEKAATNDEWMAWDDVLLALDKARLRDQVFKRPDVLRFIESLQTHLVESGLIGKSNALPDLVKTVYRELLLGDAKAFRVPDTPEAVAQTLITFQNSHRPQDLFKLVTPDYRKANIWMQLKTGDNVDMSALIKAVDAFMAANPAPVTLEHKWFGLTYINVVWQEKMVNGMLKAFLGSFVIVLILMVVLFRSLAWGLLSMVPLTVTIATIYGVIGLIGKDYDMPIAILSALSLGLAVDYAIHFNVRSRQIHARLGTWRETVKVAFGEPARAIFRNLVVVGAGFLPLLIAPLVPYQTVGVFISAILVTAGMATLFGIPALITIFQRFLFKERNA